MLSMILFNFSDTGIGFYITYKYRELEPYSSLDDWKTPIRIHLTIRVGLFYSFFRLMEVRSRNIINWRFAEFPYPEVSALAITSISSGCLSTWILEPRSPWHRGWQSQVSIKTHRRSCEFEGGSLFPGRKLDRPSLHVFLLDAYIHIPLPIYIIVPSIDTQPYKPRDTVTLYRREHKRATIVDSEQ